MLHDLNWKYQTVGLSLYLYLEEIMKLRVVSPWIISDELGVINAFIGQFLCVGAAVKSLTERVFFSINPLLACSHDRISNTCFQVTTNL